MVGYKKTYIKYFGIGEQDRPLCECGCGRELIDVHHVIFRSQNGSNDITNLIGLSRYCHNKAHNSKEFNNKLKEIVKQRNIDNGEVF